MSLITRRKMPLGDAIAQYRKEHDMSLRAFARSTGLSATYISMIEKGVNARGSIPMPSVDTYRAIAKAMGLSLVELFSIVDEDEYKPYYFDSSETFDEFGNSSGEEVTITFNDPDPDMLALLEDLRTRPDMRMLFKLAHGATEDDLRQAVKIIEALRK